MANNYNELKVFTLNSLGGPAVVNVYLCRGIACDVMRDWGRFYRDNARIEESQILFCGDSPEKGATLYRRFEWDNGHETGRVTPWYLTDDEAIKAAEAMHFKPIDVFNGKKYYAYQTGYLNTEFIEPIQQVEVEFKLNDKGRLYTRLNAHPERDGKNISGGKFFFPDKSFTTADVGKAVVSVSKEFDNFGFLVGKMKKVDDIPEIKDILDWAWEKRAPHEELITINHPGRGRYYAVNDGEDIFPICQMQFLDEDHPHIYADEYTWIPAELDAERYIEDRATFFELFAKDAWGQTVSMEDVNSMFKESDFFVATDRPGINWWEDSIKYHSDVLTKAVEVGILAQYKMPILHIEVISVSCNNILELLRYPFEEIKQIGIEMSAINTEADKVAEKARCTGRFAW